MKKTVTLFAISKFLLIIFLFASIVWLQVFYDAHKSKASAEVFLPAVSAQTLKIVDLGLNSVIATYMWSMNAMSETFKLSDNNHRFLADFQYLTDVEPRFSFPYYYSELVLANLPRYKEGPKLAAEIGQQGVLNGDPDWRVPFYLAMDYYLELKDKASAAKYFDIAARTPGAPYYIQRFSINYSIGDNERKTTEQIWEAIYQGATDDFTKERARAYIIRLRTLDTIEAAANIYKARYGNYPAGIDELVAKKILPGIPIDPFGFKFVLDGNVAGIDKSDH